MSTYFHRMTIHNEEKQKAKEKSFPVELPKNYLKIKSDFMELIKTTGFRKIINPDRTFQMLIPPTWRYWVMEEHVHCLEDNEIGSDEDCFQFSVTLLTNIERTELAEGLSYLPSIQVGDFDCREHNFQ